MVEVEGLTKRIAIDKANFQMVVIVGVASFISVFCLIASNTVWNQDSYQSRVISAQSKANQELLKDISAYNTLTNSYEAFVSTPNNVIGGNSTGTGSNDGNNAKIVLDALPPSYDFPALATTLANILNKNGLPPTGITGVDNQLTQQSNSSSSNPQPVSMPFTFSISSVSYQAVTQLVDSLNHSIRPMQIDTMTLSGSASNMTLSIDAHTYYQPAKSLSITKQAVK